ncbi:hypothetical protein [Gardnerella vaginalis]|uniref:Peptidase n=1 Tax=Gardnerella vaginalis TaxID=2702 RepID=A0A2K1STZ5_GARVA|nr:hypothetical protein [Gardnerella vaginalis]PNS42975.1 hypothetical protein BFS05_05110 [Gardnerella vaginalis]
MLNKKAIAALAAGATLVSGLAFATPSFAAETPKQATCTVDQDKVDDANNALAEALATKSAKKVALNKANKDLKTGNEQLGKVNNLKKTKEDADKAKEDADKAVAASKAADTSAEKLELKAKAAAAAEAATKAQENLTKGLSDAAKALGDDTLDAVEKVKTKVASLKTAVHDAKVSLDEAEQDVKDAQAELAKAECKTTPAPAPQPGPQPGPKPLPDVPSIPLRDMDHDQIRALTRLENAYVVLKKDQAAFESLHSEYLKSKANYYSALAKYQAVDKEYVAAQQKVADLKAAGKEGTDAYKAALNDEQAVSARYTAAQASLDEAAADFQAKTVAVNAAADKFNADLVLYRNAYNNAVAVRANVSGFPKPDDVAKAPTFGVPNQVKEAAKKAEAKKGAVKKSGAAAPSGAKLDTKAAAAASAAPLSKTGVTVMFTALAASMLAGIGAAVRKFRH